MNTDNHHIIDLVRAITVITNTKHIIGIISRKTQKYIWVVVKIMVPFWVPIRIRHLLFRLPKKGP